MIREALARTIIVTGATVGIVTVVAVGSWPDSSRSLSDRLRFGPGATNHPVGMRPTRAARIPRGWPLQPDGTVGCSTCHTRLPALDGGGDPSLRGDPSAGRGAFCANCHDGGSERTVAAMHWLATDRAHALPDDDRRGRTASAIDSASRKCLECHDGVNASATSYQTGSHRGPGAAGDRARNHPIGVAYPRSGGRSRESQLRVPQMLPHAVRLPDGMVSCVSCHDVYNSTPKRLTVPIEGSQLCFACHEMD
jgi:predicted CXXCH cytochrome family protein